MTRKTLFIVDDLEQSRIVIRRLVAKYFPEVEIVGEAADLETARKLIPEIQPQMLILDIQMRKGTTFELVEGWLKEGNLPYVFTFITAHGNEDIAVKAFRNNAIEYIRKPVSAEHFKVAMDKMIAKIDSGHDITAQLKSLVQQMHAPHRQPEKIFVTLIDKSVNRIDIDDIIYIKSNRGATVHIYLRNGERLTANHNIGFFLDLQLDSLLKANQSVLINKEHFKSYQKKDLTIKMDHTKDVISVSTRQKKVVESFLSNKKGSRFRSWSPF